MVKSSQGSVVFSPIYSASLLCHVNKEICNMLLILLHCIPKSRNAMLYIASQGYIAIQYTLPPNIFRVAI